VRRREHKQAAGTRKLAASSELDRLRVLDFSSSTHTARHWGLARPLQKAVDAQHNGVMAQQARSESGTAISALSSLMVDGLASHEKKKRLISNACNVRDVASLVALCTSTGGLLDDESRQKACKFASSPCMQPNTNAHQGLSCSAVMTRAGQTRRTGTLCRDIVMKIRSNST
jgi:hypothetical protein